MRCVWVLDWWDWWDWITIMTLRSHAAPHRLLVGWGPQQGQMMCGASNQRCLLLLLYDHVWWDGEEMLVSDMGITAAMQVP